jgi:hypothetical protein
MSSLFLGFLGGVLGWLTTTFIASPISEFLKLRTEAGTALARFEDFDRFDPEKDDDVDEPLKVIRADALRSCGSRLVGFDLSNQIVSRVARILKFRLADAGYHLISLSELRPYGSQNEMFRQFIYQSLKLGRPIEGTDERW